MRPQAHTFLFADLVGFTALAEAEGDDRALEAVLALQRRVHDLLEEHSAEQVKAIGDGLMLRCSDPEAAVKLGLRVIEGVADEAGVPPVRIGIHTGPALASEGDWYGRTVNVAARLCAVAPGGEVMVSESTRSAAGEMPDIEWGERELHWLRNVSEPVGTYLVSPQREAGVAQVGPQRKAGIMEVSPQRKAGIMQVGPQRKAGIMEVSPQRKASEATLRPGPRLGFRCVRKLTREVMG